MSSPNTSSLQNPDTNHSFMSKHKKKFIIAGISVTALAAIYYAYINGYISPELISKSKEFLSSFGEKLLEITKYSVNFFKENLIISSILAVIAVLITYFTYQAYKKRSEENQQEQKIASIINDLNTKFNNLKTKLEDNKVEILYTDLIDNNKTTELGDALLNLINAYDKITPEILSDEELNKALEGFKTSITTISYQDTNNDAKVEIKINANDFKILKSTQNEKTNLHLPQIIQKLKPLKDILVPNKLDLNNVEGKDNNNNKQKNENGK